MKSLIKNAHKYIVALTFVVFWCAFAYEYGFFWVVGRSLQSLMSTSDYLASAVAWLPPVFLFGMLGMGIHYFFNRIEGFRTKEPIQAPTKGSVQAPTEGSVQATKATPRKVWSNPDLPLYVLVATLVIASINQLLFGNIYE
jgi:hypothetical protein